jgi:hypothetical protein
MSTLPAAAADCIFCAIVRGEAPATFRLPPGYGEEPPRAVLEETAARITSGIPPAGAR